MEPHAYLNCRRAQGILKIMAEYGGKSFYERVCGRALNRGVKLPCTFKAMLKAEEKQGVLNRGLSISELGKQMIRDVISNADVSGHMILAPFETRVFTKEIG